MTNDPTTQQQLQAQQLAQVQQMLGNQNNQQMAPVYSPWQGAAALMGALMSPSQQGPGISGTASSSAALNRGISPTFGSEQDNQWYDDQGNPVSAPAQANAGDINSLMSMIFGGGT